MEKNGSSKCIASKKPKALPFQNLLFCGMGMPASNICNRKAHFEFWPVPLSSLKLRVLYGGSQDQNQNRFLFSVLVPSYLSPRCLGNGVVVVVFTHEKFLSVFGFIPLMLAFRSSSLAKSRLAMRQNKQKSTQPASQAVERRMQDKCLLPGLKYRP